LIPPPSKTKVPVADGLWYDREKIYSTGLEEAALDVVKAGSRVGHAHSHQAPKYQATSIAPPGAKIALLEKCEYRRTFARDLRRDPLVFIAHAVND
jgi:hypothetical protein